jgi:ATP-dependent Clp protease protease subunit
MAKEILHYFGFHSWTCEALINKIDEYMDEEIALRLNSPGGDLFAAVGVYAKITEHGNVTMKVDGLAASAGFFATLYAKRVECLDVSRFMVHRADMYVNDPQQQMLLNDINKDHRKKLEARVSDELFKEVTGISIADLFNPEQRTDIWVDAKGMKKLGLVQKVNVLKTADQKAMAEAMMSWGFEKPTATQPPPAPPKPTQQNDTDMTIDKLKAEFPLVYAAILALGKTEGEIAERERVGAWQAWASVDPKKVAEGIASGKPVSAKDTQELMVAGLAGNKLEAIKKDSAKDVNVTGGEDNGAGADGKDKELKAFGAGLDEALGKKKVA